MQTTECRVQTDSCILHAACCMLHAAYCWTGSQHSQSLTHTPPSPPLRSASPSPTSSSSGKTSKRCPRPYSPPRRARSPTPSSSASCCCPSSGCAPSSASPSPRCWRTWPSYSASSRSTHTTSRTWPTNAPSTCVPAARQCPHRPPTHSQAYATMLWPPAGAARGHTAAVFRNCRFYL